MTSTPPADTNDSQEELREFVQWLLVAVGCKYEDQVDSAVLATVPDSLQVRLDCGESLTVNFEAAGDDDEAGVISAESPIVEKLIAELKSQKKVGRAVPDNQPESVRDVSQRLFEQYTIDGGSVHLGGCTLEDRVILRVTYLDRDNESANAARLCHRFVTLAGDSIEESLVKQLGLNRLVVPEKPIRVTDDQGDRWSQLGQAVIEATGSSSNNGLLLTTAIWCKYAEGKLSFVIGDATKSLSFSGWAQLFVDGSEKPPPLRCPCYESGSHHLAATDAGEIVPVEAIAHCSESGRRVLLNQLETCLATDAKALPEYFATCPASGDRVLAKAIVACETCAQLVSPTSLDAGQCSACRSLEKVSKDDPRMARLLGEYPNLDRWSSWKMVETAAAYVLVASSFAKRLLIVVDKNDLSILRMAKGSRFNKKWSEASEVDRTAYLG